MDICFDRRTGQIASSLQSIGVLEEKLYLIFNINLKLSKKIIIPCMSESAPYKTQMFNIYDSYLPVLKNEYCIKSPLIVALNESLHN